MKSLAWIERVGSPHNESEERKFFVGWGPWSAATYRYAERPAFYVQDFWGADPFPWKHPAEWLELSLDEMHLLFSGLAGSRSESLTAASVQLEALRRDAFQKRFQEIQKLIGLGQLKKMVPVLSERGHFCQPQPISQRVAHFVLKSLESQAKGLFAYGYVHNDQAFVGATPEYLFLQHGQDYAGMALAGTRAIDHSAELMGDGKEIYEHELVVSDIERALLGAADLTLGERELWPLAKLAHLRTEIFFRGEFSFADLVRKLHPTAALGVSPRNAATHDYFKQLRGEGSASAHFGAPFGVEFRDGDAQCLVAIRNLYFDARHLQITSGCGVVAESNFEKEWQELALKRRAVKSLFDIRAEAPHEIQP